MTEDRTYETTESGGIPVRRETATTTFRETTPVVAQSSPDVYQQTQVIAPRDRVRWGPIVAGLLTAIGTFLLLSTLALVIGVGAVPRGTDAGDTAAASGIVTALIGLVSFLVGGFVAGRTAAVEGRGNGALNGFLVWALGIVLILLIAALGLGGLFGAAGDLFSQYRAAGSPEPNVDSADVAQGIRDAALPAFLGLALPALAATIGGFFGGRDELGADVRQVGGRAF